MTPEEIAQVVAERIGAPLSAVNQVLQLDDAAELDRIAKALALHIPGEWAIFLAAHLAARPAEDAERLADAIRKIHPSNR